MYLFIFLILVLWSVCGLIFATLLGADLKKSYKRSLNTLHFISLSDLFNHSHVLDELADEHKSLFDNLVSLMYAYKKDISLEEISIFLEEMNVEEKNQVSKSLTALFSSNNKEYQHIASLYVSIQVIWETYFEVQTESNLKIFKHSIKFAMYQNITTIERLKEQALLNIQSIKEGAGYTPNYDYNIA